MVEGAELPINWFIEKKGDRLNPKEKVSVITSPFLNSLEFPVLIPDSDLQNVHPIHKKSIPGNKNTSGTSSRKTKVLSKVLGKINQRPQTDWTLHKGFRYPSKENPPKNQKV